MTKLLQEFLSESEAGLLAENCQGSSRKRVPTSVDTRAFHTIPGHSTSSPNHDHATSCAVVHTFGLRDRKLGSISYSNSFKFVMGVLTFARRQPARRTPVEAFDRCLLGLADGRSHQLTTLARTKTWSFSEALKAGSRARPRSKRQENLLCAPLCLGHAATHSGAHCSCPLPPAGCTSIARQACCHRITGLALQRGDVYAIRIMLKKR